MYIKLRDWSSEGLSTDYTNSENFLQCSTYIQDTTTIRVSFMYENSFVDRNLFLFLMIFFGIITFISVLFLLSSVVIFIISGKKLFSHDINVLHFNHTLTLLLAIISLSLSILVITSLDWCLAVTFLFQFLWINVFISSLSIAILVFYSIWVVSIRHTARKLYRYLIPIGLCVSFFWAVGWLVYDILQDTCDSQFKKCTLIYNRNFRIVWAFLAPFTGILLINTILLILSLIKIWFALKRQNSHEGEFKRLRKLAIGGILLIPSLSLPFISLVIIEILRKNNKLDVKLELLIVMLINSPIGIVHFILITCQIKETVLRKCGCYCKSRCCKKTLPKLAHSLHLNVVRKPRTKQQINYDIFQEPVSTNNDVIQEPVPSNDDVIQEPVPTNDDVIQEPVPSNNDVIQEPVSINEESAVYSNECTESTN